MEFSSLCFCASGSKGPSTPLFISPQPRPFLNPSLRSKETWRLTHESWKHSAKWKEFSHQKWLTVWFYYRKEPQLWNPRVRKQCWVRGTGELLHCGPNNVGERESQILQDRSLFLYKMKPKWKLDFPIYFKNIVLLNKINKLLKERVVKNTILALASVAQLVGAWFCNWTSGYMPRLWVQSLVWARAGDHQLMFLSHTDASLSCQCFFSTSMFLSPPFLLPSSH